MRLVLDERIAADRVRAEGVALRQATALEVQNLVYALRGYHDEIHQRARIAREITTEAAAEEVARTVGPLRTLVEWTLEVLNAPIAAAVETAPRAGHAPLSRDRPLTREPAIAPPGSAPALPSGPACVAVGLGTRPEPSASRRSTVVGPVPAARDLGDSGAWIGPIDHAQTPADVPAANGERPGDLACTPPGGPRRPVAVTLVSMVAVSASSARPAPTVEIAPDASANRDRGAS
jgi:hypothetical protein